MANCFQHASSDGNHTMPKPLGAKGLLLHLFWQEWRSHCLQSFIYWKHHWYRRCRKPEYLHKPLLISSKKTPNCHILKPDNVSLKPVLNSHASIGGRFGRGCANPYNTRCPNTAERSLSFTGEVDFPSGDARRGYLASGLPLTPTMMSLPSRRPTKTWLLPWVTVRHWIGTNSCRAVMVFSLHNSQYTDDKLTLKLNSCRAVMVLSLHNSQYTDDKLTLKMNGCRAVMVLSLHNSQYTDDKLTLKMNGCRAVMVLSLHNSQYTDDKLTLKMNGCRAVMVLSLHNSQHTDDELTLKLNQHFVMDFNQQTPRKNDDLLAKSH